MSRRDISVILERLTLDHRTSLADKASSHLQAVESNRTIKNQPSHAAICVDIAAQQLSIDVSRQALIRLSGAATPSAYNTSLQSLLRLLDGDSLAGSMKSSQKNGPNMDSQHAAIDTSTHGNMRRLLEEATLTYLRQLCIQYGSMELEGLVLDCLDQFFEAWVQTLPPAQRVHVHYTDPKWAGAAFWLCAMARTMTIGKDEASVYSESTTPGSKKEKKLPVRKIGGRGGKELKDMILLAVEHKVAKPELEKTIRLMESATGEYLMSLRPTKGVLAPPTPRKRKISAVDDAPAIPPAPMTSNRNQRSVLVQQWRDSKASDSHQDDPLNPFLDHPPTRRTESPRSDVYHSMSAKRQVSNVSQMSFSSEPEDEVSIVTVPKATRAPSKRTKLDPRVTPVAAVPLPVMSSADIMNPKKNKSKKSFKNKPSIPPVAEPVSLRRRKPGGVFSMIPRVKYEHTKVYVQYQEWKARILRTLASAS